MDANIAYPICFIILISYSAWIVSGQRKTIDKLTDKLMAKDLTEYRRGSVPIPDEPKMRKAQSFYDDPSIELEQDLVK